MKTAISLATHVRGLIRLTNEDDETVDARVSVAESGFDPVDSVRVRIEPQEPRPFTCHILFPEIMLDAMPSRITLDIKVNSEETDVVVDGADREEPDAWHFPSIATVIGFKEATHSIWASRTWSGRRSERGRSPLPSVSSTF